jgi:hypothetical protein
LIVLQSERTTYPFPIAVFVFAFRFVEVLRVEANDCKGKDQLQEPKDQVDDVLNREARTAGHLGLRGGVRGEVAARERSTGTKLRRIR